MSGGGEGVGNTILLVDDSERIRALMRAILEGNQWEIREAASAEEALRVAQQAGARIGMLLTDLTLPGMNGLDLASELRRVSPGLKVLFTSGNTLPDAAVPGSQFIEKPFQPAELLAKVRQMMP